MRYKLYGKECSTNWRWVPRAVVSILPGDPAKITQGEDLDRVQADYPGLTEPEALLQK